MTGPVSDDTGGPYVFLLFYLFFVAGNILVAIVLSEVTQVTDMRLALGCALITALQTIFFIPLRGNKKALKIFMSGWVFAAIIAMAYLWEFGLQSAPL